MIHDVLHTIPELGVVVRPVARITAVRPTGWGTGSDAPRTALEAARLLQAAGHQVCLVSDGDHTCLTDGRPSLVDLP